jgi:NADP-dependent 3-hydroxy acid dehydrogenase YdfG
MTMKNLNEYFGSNISQKNIVITGGTTGIGKATAELLLSLGARVLIFGRNPDDFNATFDELSVKYPETELFGTPADVTNEDDIKKIFDIVDLNMGHIDILINNAALSSQGIIDSADWKYIIDTNIKGYIDFAQQAVLRMKTQQSGHIINVGSMSAEVRNAESTIYVTTKAAINGFTASLRKEINPLRIKVTLIEPGAVMSDMQPGTKEEQREKIEKMEMLDADDVAMSILFILSQPLRCDIVSMQIRPLLQII